MPAYEQQEFSAREMYEGLLTIEFLIKSAEVTSGAAAVGSVVLSALGIWREEYAVMGALAGTSVMVAMHKAAQWVHKGAEQHRVNIVPDPTLDKC